MIFEFFCGENVFDNKTLKWVWQEYDLSEIEINVTIKLLVVQEIENLLNEFFLWCVMSDISAQQYSTFFPVVFVAFIRCEIYIKKIPFLDFELFI